MDTSENDAPQAHSMTIIIVGAFSGNTIVSDQLRSFLEQVETALFATFPDFLPANPAVTIQTAELRDDWIKTRR